MSRNMIIDGLDWETFHLEELDYCEESDCPGHGVLCHGCDDEVEDGWFCLDGGENLCYWCFDHQVLYKDTEWNAPVKNYEEVTFLLSALLTGVSYVLPFGVDHV